MADSSPAATPQAGSGLPSEPHALTADALLEALQSHPDGLQPAEVDARRSRYGPNRLPTPPPTPAWKRLLHQFRSLFIYVLLGSAVISYALGHLVDAGVILAVVLINGLIGFIQEGKAEAALQSILSLSTTHCLVLRAGQLRSLDSAELVPGDIVSLQAGDRVPADLRLLQSKDLRSDESALTGESQASEKLCNAVPADSPLAERHNMVFMGTMIVAGTARGLVTHTGTATQIGSINTLVNTVPSQATPLQKQLAALARQLTLSVLVLCALIIAYGMSVHGYGFGEMLQSAIAIAVAAIPEELPAIVTIVLAIGVIRMARRSALVRRLPAVEVLGSVDIICTDKTGTLTANVMSVRALATAGADVDVSGEGYAPEGSLSACDPAWQATITQAALLSQLCNDASLGMDDSGHWQVHGDPTEGALLGFAGKVMGSEGIHLRYPRLDALPFETERRYMATLHATPEGHHLIALKGAPERLLQMCRSQWGTQGPEPLSVETWEAKIALLAAKGMRVMALASKRTPQAQLRHEDVETGMEMIALLGISDPPRAEAIDAIAECHRAGIRVKMITGDNPLTATAIGHELGLNTARVLTGQELDAMDETTLGQAAEEVDIYARTSPVNKLQLVAALQARRHVVAMTGDGVNDAPALRKADIGVAMGMKGTDAAREAGDIVLTDDNFATIAQAVAVGRTVYDNTIKSILFMLPTNLAEAGIVLMAILFGWVLPVTAPQILWINMVTTVTLSLALAFEMSERDIMQHPPRPYGQGLITPLLLRRLLLVGASSALVIFGLFLWQLERHDSLERARTVAVNIVVMIEALYLFSSRFFTLSVLHPDMRRGSAPVLISVALVVLAQLLFTYLPVSQRIFAVEALSLGDWGLVMAGSLLVLVLVEIDKAWARRAATGNAAT
ncbi:MAG: HAD-IC family P-type ATPase [Pseudomonadales bacterium]|nr:HAD-IC family P-type ATPase [Pseudomonadales bacterium]